jgi:hypothetical protein
MSEQQLAEQRRLAEILRLARMQLNEEYMKDYASAHTTWLTTSRNAWQTSNTLIPFTTQFKYPSEEEVIARGVEIYKTLNGVKATEPVVEKPIDVVAYTPETAFTGTVEPAKEANLEPVIDAEVKEETGEIEDRFKSLITKWGGKGNY